MAKLSVAPSLRSSVHSGTCAVALAALIGVGCGPAGGDNGGNPGSGGSSGTGTAGSGTGTAGMLGTGGSATGTGGSATGTGGSATGTGGSATGTGGSATGTGGSATGTGGSATGTGGSATGTGGSGTGGSASGSAGSGGGNLGTAGRGGTTGAGGSAGTTGAAGRGGTTGAGGVAGSGTGTAGAGGSSSGPVYNPNFKEFYGDDCTVADPKDVNITELPNLFTNLDGSTMAKKSDWRCRRAELKKIVEKYIHGPKPGKPDTVTGTVSNTAISVHVVYMNKPAIDFTVTVSLPTGTTGPVPIIIGMGGSSLDATIVRGEGVATGTYNHQQMASETSRSGLFTNLYGTGTGASAQVAWAWGISRVIDVLVAEKAAGRNNIIDPTAVGITGCSRNGKAAFTVGAFDERIALGIPQESGTGGVSAFRVVNTAPKGPNGMPAQSLDSAWSEAQGWFGVPFGSYRSKVNTIPGDTSSLVAMYAPRGLLVLDNSRIGELCATCQHAASAAGAKLYGALGIAKNIAYNGGNPTDPHDHCTFYPNTQGDPLRRAIRAHLTKKAAPDGRMEPQPAGTADLTKWVPWNAPTLADDVSWASPPLTSQ